LCEINIKITVKCCDVNTPSLGSLQVLLAKIVNYCIDKIHYNSMYTIFIKTTYYYIVFYQFNNS